MTTYLIDVKLLEGVFDGQVEFRGKKPFFFWACLDPEPKL